MSQKYLLPKEVITAISPNDFGDKFNIIQLANSALNTCGDLSGDAIVSNIFKEVITGDETSGRFLYKDLVSFCPKALHVFATNVLPTFKSGIDEGIKRRMLIISFNRKIPQEERIANISEIIAKREKDALLYMAIEGAKRLILQKNFTIPPSSLEILKIWEERADPVRAWTASCIIEAPYNRIAKRTIFNSFKNWAILEGYQPNHLPSINKFTERLRGLIPYLKEPRESRARCYEGIEIIDTDIYDAANNYKQ